MYRHSPMHTHWHKQTHILDMHHTNTCTHWHKETLTYSQAFRLKTHRGANHSRRLVACLADYQSSKYHSERAHAATSILPHTHTHTHTHMHTHTRTCTCTLDAHTLRCLVNVLIIIIIVIFFPFFGFSLCYFFLSWLEKELQLASAGAKYQDRDLKSQNCSVGQVAPESSGLGSGRWIRAKWL